MNGQDSEESLLLERLDEKVDDILVCMSAREGADGWEMED